MKTLRCLVIFWQPSIVNALTEFLNKDKIGHRYVIQYFHLKGLSPTNIKAELNSTLGESAPSLTLIKCCAAKFKRGRTTYQVNIVMINQMRWPRQKWLRKFTKWYWMTVDWNVVGWKMVGISKNAVHRILTEN